MSLIPTLAVMSWPSPAEDKASHVMCQNELESTIYEHACYVEAENRTLILCDGKFDELNASGQLFK